MKMLFAGGKCNNKCFQSYGGCEVHKGDRDKELTADKVAFWLGVYHSQGERIFLYTPDMFSDYYYEKIYKKLPLVRFMRDGNIYIAVNASVRNLTDKVVDFSDLLAVGIREIWLGVESASARIRNKYNKTSFSNSEVLDITKKCKDLGIEICWYLIDGVEDTSSTRLMTYDLILKGNPNRVRFARLTDEA